MPNTYEFLDSYVKIIDNKGRHCLVDLDDFDKVKYYYWLQDVSSGYFTSRIQGKKVYLHCFILPSPDGFDTDHKSRDKSDCRKSNLRLATRSQNLCNRGLRKDNTLRCRGVRLNGSKYEVRIQLQGKRKTIGRFSTLEEAVEARLQAEKQYFGEFSPN